MHTPALAAALTTSPLQDPERFPSPGFLEAVVMLRTSAEMESSDENQDWAIGELRQDSSSSTII